MPPKPRRRVKQPEKKKLRQKQKQKQQQNVRVNVTQSGGGASGGGGGSFPVYIPQQTPQQFRDTSGENVKLTGLIQSLENRIANFRPPVVAPVAVEPVANPANDAATQTAVFNAPITYNDDLAEEVIRDIDNLYVKPKPIAKPPPIFNAPNDNNMSLADRIRESEEESFNTPVRRQRAESAPPDVGESSSNPFTGTPSEPYINRNGRWRSNVKRGDLEKLAQDYGLPVTGVDDNGREIKLSKEQLKSILNTRLGI
jgi:hypothetical protein